MQRWRFYTICGQVGVLRLMAFLAAPRILDLTRPPRSVKQVESFGSQTGNALPEMVGHSLFSRSVRLPPIPRPLRLAIGLPGAVGQLTTRKQTSSRRAIDHRVAAGGVTQSPGFAELFNAACALGLPIRSLRRGG